MFLNLCYKAKEKTHGFWVDKNGQTAPVRRVLSVSYWLVQHLGEDFLYHWQNIPVPHVQGQSQKVDMRGNFETKIKKQTFFWLGFCVFEDSCFLTFQSGLLTESEKSIDLTLSIDRSIFSTFYFCYRM